MGDRTRGGSCDLIRSYTSILPEFDAFRRCTAGASSCREVFSLVFKWARLLFCGSHNLAELDRRQVLVAFIFGAIYVIHCYSQRVAFANPERVACSYCGLKLERITAESP